MTRHIITFQRREPDQDEDLVQDVGFSQLVEPGFYAIYIAGQVGLEESCVGVDLLFLAQRLEAGPRCKWRGIRSQENFGGNLISRPSK